MAPPPHPPPVPPPAPVDLLLLCSAPLQSLISPRSRWKSSTYLSLPSLRPARPSLTCLFPNRIAPFSPSPSPSPSHLVPRLLFTIRPGLSSASAALFVFLPPLFFFTQMSGSCLPPHFSSPFSPLKVNNLRLHITTVLVCFPRCLSDPLLFSNCVFSPSLSDVCLSCWCVQTCSKWLPLSQYFHLSVQLCHF